MTAREWHSRGYLPHWEAGETPQSITFRLADSLPAPLLDQWRIELERLPIESATLERRIRVQIALDQGHGSSALADAAIADIVEETLLYFDAVRYRLHAWCIMPNHVHVLATPTEDWTLSAIVHTWKSFTAKRANASLGREGQFWAQEYYDRAIRDENHYAAALSYIEMNPVKAGFCKRSEDWRYSSVRVREPSDWVHAQCDPEEKSGRAARGPRKERNNAILRIRKLRRLGLGRSRRP